LFLLLLASDELRQGAAIAIIFLGDQFGGAGVDVVVDGRVGGVGVNHVDLCPLHHLVAIVGVV